MSTKDGDGSTGPGNPDEFLGLKMLESLADNTASPEVRAQLERLARCSDAWRDAVAAYTPMSSEERRELIARALAKEAGAPVSAGAVEARGAADRGWWAWFLKKLSVWWSRMLVVPTMAAALVAIYPWPIARYGVERDALSSECRAFGDAVPEAPECKVWRFVPDENSKFQSTADIAVYERGTSSALVLPRFDSGKGSVEIRKPKNYLEGKEFYFVVGRAGKMPASLEQALKECALPESECQVLREEPEKVGAP